ncbi:MAG: hypothetical protein IPL96_09545, partial [Holophagaceae bacterium]|nr:hypothetical protein [Holophagaceae bacterium]
MLGIPNFWNVLSNAPFLPFGVWGLIVLRKAPSASTIPEAWAYRGARGKVVLVGFGSSYYHWHPNKHTLFWDQPPMTLVFMVSAERPDRRAHPAPASAPSNSLPPLPGARVLAIDVRRRGDFTGVGDLRFVRAGSSHPML